MEFLLHNTGRQIAEIRLQDRIFQRWDWHLKLLPWKATDPSPFAQHQRGVTRHPSFGSRVFFKNPRDTKRKTTNNQSLVVILCGCSYTWNVFNPFRHYEDPAMKSCSVHWPAISPSEMTYIYVFNIQIPWVKGFRMNWTHIFENSSTPRDIFGI